MPKVSIVLPTYNGEKFIKESIESVINQTFTDWELIIVNDCSTDGTQDIISIDSGLKKKYDYIVIGVLNKELAMKIKRQLVDKYKINTDKILWREAKHLSIFGLM